jgi:hypothetical protein
MIERELPTAENIASCREQFGSFTDAELITRAYKEPQGASGIAAKQLLAERQAAFATAKQEELLAEIRKPHWSVTPAFTVGVVAAIAGVVAAIYAYLAYAQQLPSGSAPTNTSQSAGSPARPPSAPHVLPKQE